MLPIRTSAPTRYPPAVTWTLIAINCAVFLFQASLEPRELELFLLNFALIPARYFMPHVFGLPEASLFDYLPFVTNMFLHGGLLHLLVNMWSLWLFGPAVEDRFGPGRYLIFYFACGIAASAAHAVFNATSGGTLIALAADEIVMCDHSVLGPIDPQLGQSPAASLLKVVEQKPIAEIDDQTLVMADIGRKAIAQVKQAARELLERKMPADQAEKLAEKLSTGTWTHDYPIFANVAKELGLPVATNMPGEVLELMTLYPQPMRTQGGGVEYLPIPRQKENAPQR